MLILNGFKLIKDYGYRNGTRRGLVECKVCKRNYETDPNKLRYRKNCGCIKHGSRVCKYARSHPRIMQCYKHMMSRCYNTKNKDFYNYGAKGISVCDEWNKKPENFCEWALKNGYEKSLTIDRIDNSKGYFPKNCRWSSAKTQGRNTSRNVMTMDLAVQMRKDAEIMTYDQLKEKYKVSYGTVYNVINKRSWI